MNFTMQYFGALLVLCGISLALIPELAGGDAQSADPETNQSAVWAVVMILSCIPMTLSR